MKAILPSRPWTNGLPANMRMVSFVETDKMSSISPSLIALKT